MLECQSRQVPMKSKRTAVICPLPLAGSVDIVVCVSFLVHENVDLLAGNVRVMYYMIGSFRRYKFLKQPLI